MVSSSDAVVQGCQIWSSMTCPGYCPDILSTAMTFAFSKLLWKSTKLMPSDGAASSSDEEVICLLFSRCPLRWCRRQVTGVGFFLRCFFSPDCNFTFWLRFFLQKLEFSHIFSLVRSVFTWPVA
jgi:hypothetical protein